jgi:hypothetical protein
VLLSAATADYSTAASRPPGFDRHRRIDRHRRGGPARRRLRCRTRPSSSATRRRRVFRSERSRATSACCASIRRRRERIARQRPEQARRRGGVSGAPQAGHRRPARSARAPSGGTLGGGGKSPLGGGGQGLSRPHARACVPPHVTDSSHTVWGNAASGADVPRPIGFPIQSPGFVTKPARLSAGALALTATRRSHRAG